MVLQVCEEAVCERCITNEVCIVMVLVVCILDVPNECCVYGYIE